MRYPMLRLIIVVHYLIALGIAVGGYGAYQASHSEWRLPFAAGAAVLAALVVAVAEAMRVLIDIEANTRAASVPADAVSTPSMMTTPGEGAWSRQDKVIVGVGFALCAVLGFGVLGG
jgi:hypothetical protein